MKYILLILLISITNVYSQVPGERKKDFNPDTIIFNSPRPLISSHKSKQSVSYTIGGDLALTESGFGAGFFYQNYLRTDFLLSAQLFITGLRNSDEFEQYDPFLGWVVPGKINRLFRFPLTVGGQYFLLQDRLTESLQPYISFGAGPTFILSTPYEQGWFEAFGDAEMHTKLGGYIGIGAYFGNVMKSLIGVNIKYYYVPAGNDTIESIRGLPIENLGGLFLTLSVGKGF